MNRNTRLTLVLSVVATAAFGLSACSGGGHHGNTPMPHDIPASAGFNQADVQFAQMMIPHHAQAVEMAELAPSRASDPELKALAATIKSAQQPEIDTMTAWLKAWDRPTGHTMPGGHNMPGIMSEQDMSKLRAASGAEFDRQFATMMIAHHNGAIQMARDELRDGVNPDAKRLAAAIEQAQTAEVAQLQKILDRL